MTSRTFLRRALLRTTSLVGVVAAANSGLTIDGFRALANPVGGQVVAGQATIAQPTPALTQINQSSDRAAINWNSFSIKSGEKTNFQQPSASSVTLNRVTGPDPSTIAGQITANGNVVLVNPSGVVFSRGSQVNVNGIIATPSDIKNSDFMAGRMVFDTPSPNPNATVSNAGTITVAGKGLAALVAPGVANSGVISAKLGKVVLGGAETFTVDLYGDGLMSFDVGSKVKTAPLGSDGKVVSSIVSNSGRIEAAGGTVLLTADAVEGIVDHTIHAGGMISAPTVTGRDGTVRPGSVRIDAGATGSAVVDGTLAAVGARPGQTGGSIAVGAKSVALTGAALLDASGSAGGGGVRVGGGLHGADPTIRNAATTYVAPTARLRANATRQGNGGQVTVWSDVATGFYGSIAAKGGPAGGNGRSAEVSSHGVLDFQGTADLRAPKGRFGTLLLDPADVIIATGGSDGSFDAGGNYTANATGASTISPTAVTTQLNLSNVIIDTTTTGPNNAVVGTGTITVKAPIAYLYSAGQPVPSPTLTLTAASGISFTSSGSISAAGGKLNVVLSADQSDQIGALVTGIALANGAAIATNGGDLSLTATQGITLNTGSSLTTAGGAVALTNATLSNGFVVNGTMDATIGGVAGTGGVVTITAQGGAAPYAGAISIGQNTVDLATIDAPSINNINAKAIVLQSTGSGFIGLLSSDFTKSVPVTLNSATTISFSGTAVSFTGDLNLVTTNATASSATVTQSAANSLTVGGTLTGSLKGALTLTNNGGVGGGTNSIGTLGAFSTTDSFSLVDAASLTVNGAVSAGASVAIQTAAGHRLTVGTGGGIGSATATSPSSGDITLISGADFLQSGGTIALGANAPSTATLKIQALTGDISQTAGTISTGSAGGGQTLDLEAFGAITQSGTLTAGKLSGNASNGDATLTGSVGTLTGFTVGDASTNGSFALTDSQALVVSGNVTADKALTLKTTAGPIKISANLTSSQAVAGDLTITSATDIVQSSGTIATGTAAASGTKISLTTGAGGMLSEAAGAAITAGTAAGGQILALSVGGNISQSGSITAGVLTGSISGTTTLTSSVNIGQLSSFTVTKGSLTLTDGSGLTVSNAVDVGTGGLTITAPSLTFDSTSKVTAGAASLTANGAGAAGFITENAAGNLTLSSLAVSSNGAASFAGTGNSIKVIDTVNTSGSDFTFVSSTAVTESSGTSISAGAVSVTGALGLTLNDLTSNGTTVLSAGSGVLSLQKVDTTNHALELDAGSAMGSFVFNSGAASITSGTAATTIRSTGALFIGAAGDNSTITDSSINGISAGGGITLASTGSGNGITVASTQAASFDGNLTLNSAADITFGAGTATFTGNAGLVANAGSISFGSGGASFGQGVVLTTSSAGTVTQSGALTVSGTLSGGPRVGTVTLLNSGNQIASLGGFNTGNHDFSLTDAYVGKGGLGLSGHLNPGTGTLSLSNTAGISQQADGIIEAGTVSITAGNGLSLLSVKTSNTSGTTKLAAGSGALSLQNVTTKNALELDGGSFAFGAAIDSGANATTINASGGLTLGAAGDNAATLTDASLNRIRSTGAITIASTSGGAITIDSPNVTVKAPLTLSSAAGIGFSGAASFAGNLNLTAVGGISEANGATLSLGSGASLTGSSGSGTALGQSGNQIANLGSFSDSGSNGITIVSGETLTVAGSIQATSGAVQIASAGTLTINMAVNAATIGLTTSNGGDLKIGADLNAGSGTLTVSSAGTIDQGAGKITAGLLTGSSVGQASFAGASNSITALGNFSTGGGGLNLNTTAASFQIGNGTSGAGVGTIDLGSGTLSLTGAGTISEANGASIKAGPVSITGNTGLTLRSLTSNGVTVLSAGAGTLSLQGVTTNSNALELDGARFSFGGTISSGSAATTVKSTGNFTIGSSNDAPGTPYTLTDASLRNTFTAGSLILQATAFGNDAGDVTVVDGFYQTSTPITLSAARNITFGAGSSAFSGNLTLVTSATGTVTQSGALTVSGTLSGGATLGSVTLDNAGNSFSKLGGFNTGTNGLTLNTTGALTQVSGTISAGTATITAGSGLTLLGVTTSSTSGMTRLSAGNGTLSLQSVTTSNALELDGESFTFAGAINSGANATAINASGGLTLGAAGDNAATLTDASLNLVSASSISVSSTNGGAITVDSPNVTLTAPLMLSSAAGINFNGGTASFAKGVTLSGTSISFNASTANFGSSLTLNTTAGITQSSGGKLTVTGALAGTADGAVSLFGAANQIATLGQFSTGGNAFSLTDAVSALTLTADLNVGPSATLALVNASGTITQSAGTTITAGLLTGSSSGQASFANVSDNIASLGNFSTGGGDLTVNTTATTFQIGNGSASGAGVGTVDLGSGKLTLTAAGTIAEASGASVKAGRLTGSSSGDALFSNSGNSIAELDGFVTGNGALNLRDGNVGTLTLNGNLSLGSGTLTLNAAGPITQADNTSIIAGRLTGSSGAAASFAPAGGTNAIADLGDFATANGSLTLAVGSALAPAGLTLDGFVNLGTGTLALTAYGAIAQTDQAGSRIIAGLLTGKSNGAATFASKAGTATAANSIAQLGNFDTGTASTSNFLLTTSASLTIGDGTASAPGQGVVTAGGAVQLTSAGSLTEAATASVSSGTTLSLMAQSGNLSVSGALSAGTTLSLAAQTGNLSVAGILASATANAPDTGTISLSAANGSITQSGGSITVTAGHTLTDATIALLASAAGGISLNGGSITTQAGTVTLTNGTISQAAASSITASVLTGSTIGVANLLGSSNSIGTLGNFSADGGFTLKDGSGLVLQGSQAGDRLRSANGQNSVTSSGAIQVNEEVSAGTSLALTAGGDLSISAALSSAQYTPPGGTPSGGITLTAQGQIQQLSGQILAGNTPNSFLTTLDLEAKSGGITQSAGTSIIAATLTGSSAGTTTLGTGIQVGTLGTFTQTAGDFTLADSTALTVNGTVSIDVQSGSGTGGFNLTAPNIVFAAGSTVNAGAASLVANGAVAQNLGNVDQSQTTSTLIFSSLSGSANGNALFEGTNNKIGTLGSFSAGGSFAFAENADITVNGTLSAGQSFSLLTSGGHNITVQPGASISSGTADTSPTSNGFTANLTLQADGSLTQTGGAIFINPGQYEPTNAKLTLQATNGAISLSGGTISTGSASGSQVLDLEGKGGAITATSAITAGVLTGSAIGNSSLTGTDAIGSLAQFRVATATGVQGDTGSLTLTDGLAGAGGFSQALAITGPVNVDGTFNIATTGTLSETGSGTVKAAVVTGSSGGDTSLGGVNMISALGQFTASGTNGFTLVDNQALQITGAVSAPSGAISISTQAGGAITLASSGSVASRADTLLNAAGAIVQNGGSITAGSSGTAKLTLNAAGTVAQAGVTYSIVQNGGTIQAGTLTGQSTGPVSLVSTGNDVIGTLSAFTTSGGDFSLTDKASSLTLAGNLNLSGAGGARGTLTLNETTGAIIQNSGILTAATLTGSAVGNSMLGDANVISNLAAFSETGSGSLALNDTTGLAITGAVSVPGTFKITAGGALTESGTVTAGTLTGSAVGNSVLGGANSITNLAAFSETGSGNLTLNDVTGLAITGSVSVPGTFQVVVGGALTETGTVAAGTLTGSSGGDTTLGTQNLISSLGGFTAGGATGFTLLDNQALQITGAVGAPNGAVSITTQSGGAITLASSGSLGSGLDTLLDAAGAIVQNGGTITAGSGGTRTLTLHAAGTVTQAGRSFSIVQNGGSILAATLTGRSLGGTSLTSASNVIRTLAGFTTGGGDFNLTDQASSLSLNGNVDLSGNGPVGTLTLNETAGAITQDSGVITAAMLTGSAVGDSAFNGANVIGSLGTFAEGGSGNLAFNDATSLAITGTVTAPGTFNVTTAGSITESGSIKAGSLTGSAVGDSSLNGANAIGLLGDFSEGGSGNLVLNNTQGLVITGAVSVPGTFTLTAGGALTESGSILVGALTGSAVGDSVLGGANVITSLAAFTEAGSGNLSLNNVQGLLITGAVSVPGTFYVTVGGALAEAGAGAVAAGTLTGSASGDSVLNGANTIANLGAFTQSAGAGSGGLTLNDGQAGATQSLTISGAVNVAGTLQLTASGAIAESSGTISATVLTGSTGGSAVFRNGNLVATLGSFTAGGSGGLLLTDARPLEVNGTVNAPVGPVTLTSTNAGITQTAGLIQAGSTVGLIAGGGQIIQAGGVMSAPNLTGFSAGGTRLGDANTIATLGTFVDAANGDLLINDIQPLTVAGQVSIGGGTFTLTAPSLTFASEVEAANLVTTATAGNITETGASILSIPGVLSGFSAGSTALTGNNAIGTLGDFTASGGAGLLLNDTTSLAVVGNVSAPSGPVSLTSAGGLTQYAGRISTGATLTLAANGGRILQNGGTISAPTLTGSAVGGTTLAQPNNTVGVLGMFTDRANGSFTLADASNLTVSGPVSVGSGVFSLFAPSITFAGAVSASSILLTAKAGNIGETSSGMLTATLVSGSAVGGVTLQTANKVNTLGDFMIGGSAGLVLNDALALQVNGNVVAASGPISLTSARSITQLGGTLQSAGTLSLNAQGGDLSQVGGTMVAGSTVPATLSLIASGSISQTGGTMSAGTLTGSSSGGTSLVAQNSVNQLAAFTDSGNGDFTLTDGVPLTVAGPVSIGSGNFVLNAPTLMLTGSVNAGTATLTASAGSIDQSPDGTLNMPGSFNSFSAGGTNLRGANQLALLTNLTDTGASGISVNVARSVILNGAVSAPNGPVALSSAGDITQQNGTLSSGVSVRFRAAGSITQMAGAISAGTTLALNAGAAITQKGGSISAAILTGSSNGGASLAQSNNRVATLGAFTDGANGNLSLSDAQSLTLTDSVSIGSGTFTLNVSGQVAQTAGVITAARVTGSTASGLALNDDNAIGTLADFSNADGNPVTLSDAIALTVSGRVTSGGLVDLISSRSLTLSSPTISAGAFYAEASDAVMIDGATLTAQDRVVVRAPGGLVETGTSNVTAPLLLVDTTSLSKGLLQSLPSRSPSGDPVTPKMLFDRIPAPGPTSGNVKLDTIYAPGSTVALITGAGAITGQVNARMLGIYGSGGSANLVGVINNIGGQAAAQEGFKVPTRENAYKLNGCAIGNATCIVLPLLVPVAPRNLESVEFLQLQAPHDDPTLERLNVGNEDTF